ncbi:hypothetical protein Ciccas_004596 [Cichlidogyrus casuarinus]|uniref:Uncharacterized protein n=1 Tax=Cichlidogyrus casuarinus TaxID=1844966 RepID=A0ABD2QB31_9PLAT
MITSEYLHSQHFRVNKLSSANMRGAFAIGMVPNKTLDNLQEIWFSVAGQKDSKPDVVLAHMKAVKACQCPLERLCNMVNHNVSLVNND